MGDSAETLPRLGGGHVFDGWTTLAAMAKTTKSVRLGLLSPSAPFHNAALLAKRAASLDVISDGRFRLALRADGYLPEYARLDSPFPAARTGGQRGTSENANGLLRQYFPKGTDLSGYHREDLAFVVAEMNRRPRKRFGWRTPAGALDQLLSNLQDPPSVALTG